MFGFLKKLFGAKPVEITATAPYKVEVPTQTYESHKQKASTFADVTIAPQPVVAEKPAAVKLRQPGTPKQGQKKPAQGKKPQGAKPAQPKKPAQGTAPKQGGNKPRGRRPKAKPAAPQQ